MTDESWDRKSKLVILDEIHKRKNWKNWVKGIFDTEGVRPRLLLTGSARLDLARKGGRESLAGRHHLFRLHPFSVRELLDSYTPGAALERLLERGGFPEPFLADDLEDARRWRLSHIDSILKEDLRELSTIQDIRSVEYLVDRLASQVGSPISYQSLAEDVSVSAPTIKRWIAALQAIYAIFIVYPWSKKVKGSILKQPKIYFYDTARIPQELASARFENLVALSLLKHLQFREDAQGVKGDLFYLRNKRGLEVDFLTVEEQRPHQMIECKLSESDAVNFDTFRDVRVQQKNTVLVQNAKRNLSYPNFDIEQAAPWLSKLDA